MLYELSETTVAYESATDRPIEFNLPDPTANLQTIVLSDTQAFICAPDFNNFNAGDGSKLVAPFPCNSDTQAPVEGTGLLMAFG